MKPFEVQAQNCMLAHSTGQSKSQSFLNFREMENTLYSLMGETAKAMSMKRGEEFLSFVQLIYHIHRTYSLSYRKQTFNRLEDMNQNVKIRSDGTELQKKDIQEQALVLIVGPSEAQDGGEAKLEGIQMENPSSDTIS